MRMLLLLVAIASLSACAARQLTPDQQAFLMQYISAQRVQPLRAPPVLFVPQTHQATCTTADTQTNCIVQ